MKRARTRTPGSRCVPCGEIALHINHELLRRGGKQGKLPVRAHRNDGGVGNRVTGPGVHTVVSRCLPVLGTTCAALAPVLFTTVKVTKTESTLVVGTPPWPRIWNGYQVFGVNAPLIPPRPVLVSTTLS